MKASPLCPPFLLQLFVCLLTLPLSSISEDDSGNFYFLGFSWMPFHLNTVIYFSSSGHLTSAPYSCFCRSHQWPLFISMDIFQIATLSCILGVASFLGHVFLLSLHLLFLSSADLLNTCILPGWVKSFLSSHWYHSPWAKPICTHGLVTTSLLTASKSLSSAQLDTFTLVLCTLTQHGQNKTPHLSDPTSSFSIYFLQLK